MGFIKAGFTGGFLGIVISIADIFFNHPLLQKLSSIGLFVASSFGKVCINTSEVQCSLTEKFTTILSTIVGNCIAYFIIFSLISMAISIIVMWLTPSKKETVVESQPQVIIREVPQEPQVIVREVKVKEVKEVKEPRPKKKAKVTRKINK
jgi:hypothetical protein